MIKSFNTLSVSTLFPSAFWWQLFSHTSAVVCTSDFSGLTKKRIATSKQDRARRRRMMCEAKNHTAQGLLLYWFKPCSLPSFASFLNCCVLALMPRYPVMMLRKKQIAHQFMAQPELMVCRDAGNKNSPAAERPIVVVMMFSAAAMYLLKLLFSIFSPLSKTSDYTKVPL